MQHPLAVVERSPGISTAESLKGTISTIREPNCSRASSLTMISETTTKIHDHHQLCNTRIHARNKHVIIRTRETLVKRKTMRNNQSARSYARARFGLGRLLSVSATCREPFFCRWCGYLTPWGNHKIINVRR